MSIAFIVYLASISDGVKMSAGMAGFVIMFVNSMTFGFRCSDKLKIYWWAHIPFALLCVFLVLTAVFVPSSQDIYKIAGVTDQQKASIDASGKVLEVKK
jgi:hypothetical protein